MACRRLMEAVKGTLIRKGKWVVDNETDIVIAGSQTPTRSMQLTSEEYKQQRYEVASTLYGPQTPHTPHTLSAYIKEFKKLAATMAKGNKFIKKGKAPKPP